MAKKDTPKEWDDMTTKEKYAAVKGKKLSELSRDEAEWAGLIRPYPALKVWQGTPFDPSGAIFHHGIVDDRTDKQKQRNIIPLEFPL